MAKCILCGQVQESDHLTVYDCMKALVKRVENLENELLAKRLEGLHRSSDSGLSLIPPSSKKET